MEPMKEEASLLPSSHSSGSLRRHRSLTPYREWWRFGDAAYRDIKARLPYYLSDWTDALGHPLQVLAATIELFFVQLFLALTFALVLQRRTKGGFSVSSVLIAQAVPGMLYAIFSGQPLILLAVVGPTAEFITTLVPMADLLEVPFVPWMAWINVWTGFFLILLGGSNLALWVVRRLTPFSVQVFDLLIGSLFLKSVLEELLRWFNHESLAVALFQFILIVTTALLGIHLFAAEEWRFFSPSVRKFIASAAFPGTVVLVTALTLIGKLDMPDLARFDIEVQGASEGSWPWYVNLWSASPWTVFSASAPAFIQAVLLSFDHIASSLLALKPELHCTKPDSYSWDLSLLGLLCVLCGVGGTPAINAAIPQAPRHVSALSTPDGVIEQRMSGLLQAGLMLATVWVIPYFKRIPEAIATGVLALLSLQILTNQGNLMGERLKLCFMDKDKVPNGLQQMVDFVGLKQVYLYTGLQLFALALAFGLTFTTAGVFFPIVVLLCVPVRSLLLPKLFGQQELAELDNEGGDAHSMVRAESDSFIRRRIHSLFSRAFSDVPIALAAERRRESMP